MTTLLIDEILASAYSPTKMLQWIKYADMAEVVRQLMYSFEVSLLDKESIARRAAIMRAVNGCSKTFTLHASDNATVNVTLLKRSDHPEYLYASSGWSIFFTLGNHTFSVTRFEINGDQLTDARRELVTSANPILIDHARTVASCDIDYDEPTSLVFNINVPGSHTDVVVYDRDTLTSVAWFPGDNNVTRFLVALEALESTCDPHADLVCKELIYHYHPAVRWHAFRLLHQLAPEAARGLLPILRADSDPTLNGLIDTLLTDNNRHDID
ncbi:hypothetical protein WL40_12550 [Burkholderia ubonensis]|uniref:hypothetical protein n=1 Tax=Burkholderia ubonensis TaxID=101571 RepID=UPI0007591148|nr:hypothetical protein [Burkholderia ubonensis]KWB69834.1 hypothetical protein WL40_12550 [Burkholderia ubonensis]